MKEEGEEIEVEVFEEKEETEEIKELRASWKENIINEHLVFIQGVEIVYSEFKELLLELAMRLKD